MNRRRMWSGELVAIFVLAVVLAITITTLAALARAHLVLRRRFDLLTQRNGAVAEANGRQQHDDDVEGQEHDDDDDSRRSVVPPLQPTGSSSDEIHRELLPGSSNRLSNPIATLKKGASQVRMAIRLGQASRMGAGFASELELRAKTMEIRRLEHRLA